MDSTKYFYHLEAEIVEDDVEEEVEAHVAKEVD